MLGPMFSACIFEFSAGIVPPLYRDTSEVMSLYRLTNEHVGAVYE